MSVALALALKNWRLLLGAGAAAIVALVIALHVHHDRATAKAMDQARADNRLWVQAYRDEKRAVELQNARITEMGRAAAAWQDRAQAATAEARKAQSRAQASAAAFLKLKPKGATVCERSEDVAARIKEDLQ